MANELSWSLKTGQDNAAEEERRRQARAAAQNAADIANAGTNSQAAKDAQNRAKMASDAVETTTALNKDIKDTNAAAAAAGMDSDDYRRRQFELGDAAKRGAEYEGKVDPMAREFSGLAGLPAEERARVLAASYGQANADRQNMLMDALLAQSQGRGPSLAAEMMKQQQERNLQNLVAAQLSARGRPMGAMAARDAMGQAGAMSQAAAGQLAALRAQEQLAAQQMLGQVAGQARQQDIGFGLGKEALGQQYMGQELGLRAQDVATRLGAAQTTFGAQERSLDRAAGIEQQAQAQAAQDRNNALNGLFNFLSLGTYGLVNSFIPGDDNSDERLKTDIKPAAPGQASQPTPRAMTSEPVAETKPMTAGPIIPSQGPMAQPKTSAPTIAASSVPKPVGESDSMDRFLSKMAPMLQQGLSQVGQRFTSTSPVVGRQMTTQPSLEGLFPQQPNMLGAFTSDVQMKTGVVASDERGKVHQAGSAKDFMDSLQAYTYRYKDPNMPGSSPGKHLGVMAQELERTDVGQGMVHDTPTGKKVDGMQLASAAMASAIDLNKRLEVLEKSIGKKGKKG